MLKGQDILTQMRLLQAKSLRNDGTDIPYESGPAVYNARVLLSTIDNTVYRNNCEMAIPTKHRSMIETAANSFAIAVFPNPANDKLNVSIHLEQGETAILTIYDVTGKLVLSSILTGGADVTETSIAKLSEGMYIYKVNVNNTIVNTGKLSIIR